MNSPPTSETGGTAFDPSQPFAGVVVCCTSIPPDQRTEIATRTADLGGIHKYDLTPDVTHLIVGDYDTPKYRHVARERPDIKPMAVGWINAVRSLWVEDQDIDFAALEAQWQLKPFEARGANPDSPHAEEREPGRLLVCLTGFDEADRLYIEETVKANGGEYTGDLSRKVTHLIVCKPEGKKYMAARDWDITTVSLEWLNDSVDRGMILDEACYDPLFPKERQGKGARKELKRLPISAKRPRDGSAAPPEEGRRKLRKTASMKLAKGGNNIWGEMIVKRSSMDLSRPALDSRAASMSAIDQVAEPQQASESSQPARSMSSADPTPLPEGGVFSSCWFFVHGFPTNRSQIVCEHLVSHGGEVSSSLADVASSSHPEPADQRFLIVPQTSQPDTHPTIPEGVHIITEFYLERCIHNRRLFHPNEHVLGRPFPLFPIDGFQELTICTAGFKNEQLNQVEKTVSQLGAKYAERLNSQSSLLVCPSIKDVRRQKLDFAILSKIPVVNAEWLWQCISTGCLVPWWEEYMFPELKQRHSIDVDPDLQRHNQKLARTRSEPLYKKPKPGRRSQGSVIDGSAFRDDNKTPTTNNAGPEETSHYETAPTHPQGFSDTAPEPQPLSEASGASLNSNGKPSSKSPSKPDDDSNRKPLRRFQSGGTVADSEGGEGFDESDDDTASIRLPPSAEDLARSRKRKAEAEKEAVAAAAAEKEAAMAKEAAVKEAAKKAEREALANRLVDLIPNGAAGDSSARSPRRKRKVFGRAISNASAASSASGGGGGDSNNVVDAARPASSLSAGSTATKIMPTRIDSLNSLEGGSASQDNTMLDEDGASGKPPATQINYDNPEATRHRAVVMARMKGSGSSAAIEEKKVRQKQQQEQPVTMETLRADGDSAASGAVRRSRRR
ncbi:BRCA1 C Terminus domain-containing protein [Apiospora phragmitis]|uniref:BRCA1 C Terminus domain-containing protein n=1 Tax=Apiospora phragmitis TaxID=2905665 RepID=A0ABR1W2A7_9PEZI